jgi:hypothetical protein
MVLKHALTNSEARLLTDIDASFDIFYKPWTWIGKMIIDSQSEVPNPSVLQFPHCLHSVVSAINYLRGKEYHTAEHMFVYNVNNNQILKPKHAR